MSARDNAAQQAAKTGRQLYEEWISDVGGPDFDDLAEVTRSGWNKKAERHAPASTPEASQQAAAVAAPSECEKFSRTGRSVAVGSDRVIIATAISVEWADRIVEALTAPTAAAATAALDENKLRRLVSECQHASEMVNGHAIPQWRNLMTYVKSLAAPTAAAATTSEDARDAARWRKALMYVGAVPAFATQKFILDALVVDPSVNLLRGSVAEHFTKAIDAAMRAAQQEGGK